MNIKLDSKKFLYPQSVLLDQEDGKEKLLDKSRILNKKFNKKDQLVLLQITLK